MDPSDSEYKAMVIGGKTQLIKFYEGKNTQNLCFVTDKEDPGYGIGTEGEPGDYVEYAKELFNIPLCIDEGEGT